MTAVTVPSPSASTIPVRLRDGAVVELRPITRSDAGAVAAFFDGLTERSRYRRFHSPVPAISAPLLAMLVDVDGVDHVAWAAWADGEVVAEGRWHRAPERRDVAEVGFTVAEEWQGRGLGRVVLDTLVATACEAGVVELVADVLAENQAAVALVRGAGARIGWESGHVVGRIPVTDHCVSVPA